jgi:hypothetical protein
MSRLDTLRISYTALSLWERGDTQGFMDYMNGVRFSSTPQMQEGQDYDARACEEAVKNKRLLPEFGWYELKNPQPQLKLSIDLTTPNGVHFTLVGVIDIYDEGLIYELKTGSMPSSSYARTKQTRIYALLCKLNKLPVTGMRIARYDQYHNKADVHKMLLGEHMLRVTLRDIMKSVDEMQTFLTAMKGETT